MWILFSIKKVPLNQQRQLERKLGLADRNFNDSMIKRRMKAFKII